MILFACISIAIKNAVDSAAFPIIYTTEHKYTPLALVYYISFELEISFNEIEQDRNLLQIYIERAEGQILNSCVGLFSVMNNGATSRFESMLMDVVFLGNELSQYDESVVAHRNVVSFYCNLILCGYSESLSLRLLAVQIDRTLIYALALIASESTKHSSFSELKGLTELMKTQPNDEHRHLAADIVGVCLSSCFVSRSAAQHDSFCGSLVSYDTMRKVHTILSNS